MVLSIVALKVCVIDVLHRIVAFLLHFILFVSRYRWVGKWQSREIILRLEGDMKEGTRTQMDRLEEYFYIVFHINNYVNFTILEKTINFSNCFFFTHERETNIFTNFSIYDDN